MHKIKSYDILTKTEKDIEIDIDKNLKKLAYRKKRAYFNSNEQTEIKSTEVLAEMNLLTDGKFDFEKYKKLPSIDEKRNSGIVSAIHGGDRRMTVVEKEDEPYIYIAYLALDYSGEIYRGTGFMVGNKIAATCAHNVYDSALGGWADKIAVIAAKNPIYEPFTTANAIKYYAGYEFIATEDDEDWAVMELDYDLGGCTGYFGVEVALDKMVGKKANVTGYPRRVRDVETCEMYTHNNYIEELQNGKYKYDIDTSGGNSGSPIHYGHYAVGIHTSGDDPYNIGIAVNSVIINLIYQKR